LAAVWPMAGLVSFVLQAHGSIGRRPFNEVSARAQPAARRPYKSGHKFQTQSVAKHSQLEHFKLKAKPRLPSAAVSLFAAMNPICELPLSKLRLPD